MHARTRETRRRHFAHAQTRDLQVREPALINLPIPLPVPIASIPILGPILSPLIEGLPWPTPTSVTLAPPTTTEVPPTTTSAEPRPVSLTPIPPPSVTASASTPTSTADASIPSSSGGSSGEVSVGGGTPSSGGSGNGGGGPGDSSSSPSSGGEGGSAPGDSGGQSQVGGGGSTSVASAGADSASAAGSPQSSVGAKGAGATLSSPPGSANTNAQDTGDASESAFGASPTTTVAAMVVANVGGGTSGFTNTYSFVFTTSGASPSSAIIGTAFGASSIGLSGTQIQSSPNPSQSDGSSPSSSTTSTSSTHHVLAEGAIAAIVVVCSLFCLVIVALVLRRRAVNRRVRRRRDWLFGGQPHVYGNAAISSSRYFTDHPNGSAPNMAQHSSFMYQLPRDISGNCLATHAPPPPLQVSVPPVRRQMSGLTQPVWTSHLNGSMVFTPTLATLASSSARPTIRSPDRASWDSAKAYTDDAPSEDSACVAFPESAAMSTRSHGLPSSMSVRPFSPTDLWHFPTPPADKRLSHVSPHEQPAASPDSQRDSSDYATAPEHLPGCDSDDGAADPFRDHASTCEDARTSESVDAETASHFARVEVIRRPFVPALEDEMAVVPGERVRMLQRFPDGWARAENVATRRRGVIPIDCLRTPEQDLPAFLASKRLSSYMKRPPSSLAKVEEDEHVVSSAL